MARDTRDPTAEAAKQAGLSNAMSNSPGAAERRAYMEGVLDSDIDDASVKMLENVLADDYMLANFNNAEVHELKHLRRIVLRRVKAAHPSKNSVMQGGLRAQVYDDGNGLPALSSTQRVKIEEAVSAAFGNLTRGREGFQQEQFAKTITESHVDRGETDSGGWLSF